MTVCWHVDDLKVSHCDPAQVTIFGEWLSEKYGVAVATHCGKVHNYLGMIFDFLQKGKVMVTMMEYIKNIIKDFPEEIVGTTRLLPRTISSQSGTHPWQRCCRKNRQWHSIVRRRSFCS